MQLQQIVIVHKNRVSVAKHGMQDRQMELLDACETSDSDVQLGLSIVKCQTNNS